MIADVTQAIVELLKANAEISALVGARVYGFELPKAEAASMPRKSIVVEPSGGAREQNGYAKIAWPRLDVRIYGETVYEAMTVYRAAQDALKQARRSVHAGVLIHAANPAGGFVKSRAEDTDWPRIVASYQVMFAENEVA